MELRHLRYFAAVAEERHFGRAAARLRIAQPPLSRQIQSLEAELGFPVLSRERRRVELTAAGEVLLKHARRVFAALDLAVSEARRASAGQSGRIAIGYPSSFASSGLTELLRAYRARFPEVEMGLRELSPAEQLEALKNGDLDVGFVRSADEDPALVFERVRREPLVVALPADHRLAKQKRVRVASLARESFVSFPRSRGPGLFDQLVGLCRDAGFAPRIVQEAPQLALVSLVAAGFGVAFVPASVEALQRTGVVFKPIVGAPRADLYAVWRVGDDSPALREFLALVRRSGDAGR